MFHFVLCFVAATAGVSFLKGLLAACAPQGYAALEAAEAVFREGRNVPVKALVRLAAKGRRS